MPEARDVLRRYLDAGAAFTQMTQKRAEELAREFVRAGELQAEQTQNAVEELIERSRRNSERLLAVVRREIRQQISNLGVATKDDLARLERRIDSVAGGARKAAPKKAAAKKTAAKKVAKRATKRGS